MGSFRVRANYFAIRGQTKVDLDPIRLAYPHSLTLTDATSPHDGNGGVLHALPWVTYLNCVAVLGYFVTPRHALYGDIGILRKLVGGLRLQCKKQGESVHLFVRSSVR